ncbi:hypothetical protein [Azospirillum doebereinerae]
MSPRPFFVAWGRLCGKFNAPLNGLIRSILSQMRRVKNKRACYFGGRVIRIKAW